MRVVVLRVVVVHVVVVAAARVVARGHVARVVRRLAPLVLLRAAAQLLLARRGHRLPGRGVHHDGGGRAPPDVAVRRARGRVALGARAVRPLPVAGRRAQGADGGRGAARRRAALVGVGRARPAGRQGVAVAGRGRLQSSWKVEGEGLLPTAALLLGPDLRIRR